MQLKHLYWCSFYTPSTDQQSILTFISYDHEILIDIWVKKDTERVLFILFFLFNTAYNSYTDLYL